MAFKEPEFSKKGAEQFFEALAQMNEAQIKKPKTRKKSTAKKTTSKKK